MTQQEVLQKIIDTYQTDHIGYGSMYILPDGKLLYLGDSGWGHASVSSYINENGYEINYKEGTASNLLKSLGWIRLNTKLRFIDFCDNVFTSAQEPQLEYAIDYMEKDVQVTVKSQSKIYKNVSAEYILSRVKRCYSLGTLYENKYKKL